MHEERTVRLKNGDEVLIRPARAADADGLQALFHALSSDDVYTRFFRRVRSLSYEELQTLCNVNHETEVAFLAVTGPRENEEVVGSACYFLNPTTNLAEVAFMVAPEWQGLGLAPPCSPPAGVRHQPRRPRICRRGPAAQRAHGAPGAPRQGHGDHDQRRGCGPYHHPLSGGRSNGCSHDMGWPAARGVVSGGGRGTRLGHAARLLRPCRDLGLRPRQHALSAGVRLFDQIERRMTAYVMRTLGVEAAEAERAARRATGGTTARRWPG